MINSWCTWNRMTCTAGSDRKDFLLCSTNTRPSPLTVQPRFSLLFHFRLHQPRWRHHRTNRGDKNKSDFSVCIAKNPSENRRIFGITSERTQGIGHFVANFATKRSPNIQTWEHTLAFTRAKSHLNATIVTKASRRLSRSAVTHERTQVIDRTIANGAASPLRAFPV